MGDHLGMAELRFPVPPLAGDLMLLRPWGEADVPGIVLAFSDPVMQRFSWRTTPYTETDAVPFKGTRRDSVIYSLLPGELR
jgi:hypothetical protein